MRIRTSAEMATATPKKLRGKHALKVCSIEDALGKLGSGSMSGSEFAQLQTMLSTIQGVPSSLSSMSSRLTLPMLIEKGK
jgi:hypothetical protein